MTDIELIEQRPVTLIEVKDRLEAAKKKSKELNFRAGKVHTYVNEFVSLKRSEADKMYEKLKALNLSKLRERYIVKIIDIMPEDLDSLKSIFTGEATSFKQEELKQILDVISAR